MFSEILKLDFLGLRKLKGILNQIVKQHIERLSQINWRMLVNLTVFF